MIAIRNSSRLRVFKISASARGTTVRATTSTPITTSTAFPSASRRPLGPPAARPARKGSTSIMGTTHRSWKISTPVASRPCGASISPLSVSPFKTSAVLDRATRKPSSKAICQEVPDALATRALAATVRPTCESPPTTTCRPISRSRPSENSIPMVKSSRMTPTSARLSTWCTSDTRPSALGPSSTPATMNPGKAGSLRRWNKRMTRRDTAKMTARSRRIRYWVMGLGDISLRRLHLVSCP